MSCNKCTNVNCKNKTKCDVKPKNGTVGIIDGDGLPYAYAWLFREKDPNNPDHVKEMAGALRRSVDRMLTETKSTHFIGMLAGTEKCYRYEVEKEYKGQRVKTESYADWGPTVKAALIEMGFMTMGESPVEVDDAVGIFNRYYLDRNWDVVIIAIDKDILQLPGTHYNPVKKVWTIVDGLGEFAKENTPKISIDANGKKITKPGKNKLRANGDFLLAAQMITGDSTDNIKGLKGRGPMFAHKCLDGSCSVFDMTKRVAGAYKDIYNTTWKEEFRKTYALVKILDNEKHIEQYKIPIPIPLEIVVEKADKEFNELEVIDLADDFLDDAPIDAALNDNITESAIDDMLENTNDILSE